ncbi:MAG: hypothetical protein GXP44_01575 [bacterium]|nr:hypothetical protein [bacterium]
MEKVKIFGMTVVMVLMISALSAPAVWAETSEYTIQTDETLVIMLYKNDTAIVYYSPCEQGTRWFTSWHESALYWNKVAAMTFYWRDSSIPDDPWHSWRDASVGFLWPKVEQSLYSATHNIEYKFVFKQWTAVTLGIRVSIE